MRTSRETADEVNSELGLISAMAQRAWVQIWSYDDVGLDGDFTIEDLKAIIAAMERLKQE